MKHDLKEPDQAFGYIRCNCAYRTKTAEQSLP